MKEEYFILLGVFALILLLVITNGYFAGNKKNVEGMTVMSSSSTDNGTTKSGDTMADKSKTHLDGLKATHESLCNKVLCDNEEYKKNYGDTAITLHDIIDKLMVMKMNSIYPDDTAEVVIAKLAELNTLYNSKHSLNDVVGSLDKK
jgi:hypothetical protein